MVDHFAATLASDLAKDSHAKTLVIHPASTTHQKLTDTKASCNWGNTRSHPGGSQSLIE
jgi:O-acetylhomoserine/O-acetylserine sulfhydrylase-like pyridoxal-dependent enzyme